MPCPRSHLIGWGLNSVCWRRLGTGMILRGMGWGLRGLPHPRTSRVTPGEHQLGHKLGGQVSCPQGGLQYSPAPERCAQAEVGLNIMGGEGPSPVPEPQDSTCTCLILGGLLVAFLALPASAAQELKSLQRSVHKDADIKETFRLAKDLPCHFLTQGMKPKWMSAWA